MGQGTQRRGRLGVVGRSSAGARARPALRGVRHGRPRLQSARRAPRGVRQPGGPPRVLVPAHLLALAPGDREQDRDWALAGAHAGGTAGHGERPRLQLLFSKLLKQRQRQQYGHLDCTNLVAQIRLSIIRCTSLFKCALRAEYFFSGVRSVVQVWAAEDGDFELRG